MKHRRKNPAALAALAVLALLFGGAAVAAPALQSTWTNHPPLVNGICDSAEWDRAVVALRLQHGWVLAQNDDSTLYLLVDLTADTGNDSTSAGGGFADELQLVVDVGRDGRVTPHVDRSYAVLPVSSRSAFTYYSSPASFAGPSPTGARLASGFGTSPLGPTPHRTWELALPLTELGALPGGHVRMGLVCHSSTPAFDEEFPAGCMKDFSGLVDIALSESTLAPMVTMPEADFKRFIDDWSSVLTSFRAAARSDSHKLAVLGRFHPVGPVQRAPIVVGGQPNPASPGSGPATIVSAVPPESVERAIHGQPVGLNGQAVLAGGPETAVGPMLAESSQRYIQSQLGVPTGPAAAGSIRTTANAQTFTPPRESVAAPVYCMSQSEFNTFLTQWGAALERFQVEAAGGFTGPRVTIAPDGTVVYHYADGTTLERRGSYSRKTYPDGEVEVDSAGTVTVTHPNGHAVRTPGHILAMNIPHEMLPTPQPGDFSSPVESTWVSWEARNLRSALITLVQDPAAIDECVPAANSQLEQVRLCVYWLNDLAPELGAPVKEQQ